MTFAIRPMFDIIKTLIINHKKKFIGFALLTVIAYIIKRKLTIAHLVILVQKIIKFAEYLPLPQPPVFREISYLKAHEFKGLMEIKEMMKVESIKNKIKNGEVAEWETMKASILGGAALTVAVFPATEITNIIYHKYVLEFKQVKAEQQFTKSMKMLESYYAENISAAHKTIITMIQQQITQLQVNNEYPTNQLLDKLSQIFYSLFKEKERVDRIRSRLWTKNRNLISNNVRRLFFTNQQKPQTKPTTVKRFIDWVSSKIRFPTIINDPEYQISNQRFLLVDTLFSIPHRKLTQLRKNFNTYESEELFELVLKETEDIFQSLNFHSFYYYHCQFQTQKLLNRLAVCLHTRNLASQKFAKTLPIIYKILLEEFLSEESDIINKVFLEDQIKQAITFKINHEQTAVQPEELEHLRLINLHLHELNIKNRMDFAKNELLLKYFHERSGTQLIAKRTDHHEKDVETEQILKYFSGMNQQQP